MQIENLLVCIDTISGASISVQRNSRHPDWLRAEQRNGSAKRNSHSKPNPPPYKHVDSSA